MKLLGFTELERAGYLFSSFIVSQLRLINDSRLWYIQIYSHKTYMPCTRQIFKLKTRILPVALPFKPDYSNANILSFAAEVGLVVPTRLVLFRTNSFKKISFIRNNLCKTKLLHQNGGLINISTKTTKYLGQSGCRKNNK